MSMSLKMLFPGGDVCVSSHDSGPVFEEQPSSVIYPEGLTDGKVTLSCQARASPAASYRWVMHICIHTGMNAKGFLVSAVILLSELSYSLITVLLFFPELA